MRGITKTIPPIPKPGTIENMPNKIAIEGNMVHESLQIHTQAILDYFTNQKYTKIRLFEHRALLVPEASCSMPIAFGSTNLLNSPGPFVPIITDGFVRPLTVVAHRGSPADFPRSPSSSTPKNQESWR